MRERLIFLIFLFTSTSYAFEYGGQKFLTKAEDGGSNDDLADAEVRSIIAAIVDAILDGDRRKRSEIKDDEADSTSTGRPTNVKYTKKLNISLDTKDTVPSPKNSSLIEADIDDSLKVLNLDAKKKSDVVASKAISEELLEPPATNLPLHPLNYSTAAQITHPIDLPSLHAKQTIGEFRHASGSVYNLTAQLEKDNSELNTAGQRATDGSGSGESDKETGNQVDSLSSEVSGSGEADMKSVKQSFLEDSSIGRTSETLTKNGDVAGSAEVSGSGDARSYEGRRDEVVKQSPKQYYMKKDSLFFNSHRQVLPVSVRNTSEEDGGSGSGDEGNSEGNSEGKLTTAANINYELLQNVRRSDIPATTDGHNNDVRRTSGPTTFTVYSNPEQAGSHVSYYTSNVLKVNNFGMSKNDKTDQLPTVVRRSDIVADMESSGSGGDALAEDAASASGGGGTGSKNSDVTSGVDLSGSGSNDVVRPKVGVKEEAHDNYNVDKRQLPSDSLDISGSAEGENSSDNDRETTLPKEDGDRKSVGFHTLGESHSGEASGFSESGDFDASNGFSASGEPEADNYGDIGPDYKAYNRRNTARRRGIDDRNIVDEHMQAPVVTYSIPRSQHVSYYKESPPDDVINIPATREMGSVKATDIELNNVKNDKNDALTIVSASDDTDASGGSIASGNEVKAEIEMSSLSNHTESKPDKENSTKRESGSSLSDALNSISFTNKSHPVSHDKNGFKNDTVHIYVNKDGKVHNKTSHKQYLEYNKDLSGLKKVSSKVKASSKSNVDIKSKNNSSHSTETAATASAASEKTMEKQEKKHDVQGANVTQMLLKRLDDLKLKSDGGVEVNETHEKKDSEGGNNNQTTLVDDNNEKTIANIEAELVDDSISEVNKKNINESTGHHDDEKPDADDKSVDGGSDYIKDAISSAISSDSDTDSEAPVNNDTPKDSNHPVTGSVVHIAFGPDNKSNKGAKSNTHDIHLTKSQLKNDSIHVKIFNDGKVALTKEEHKKEKHKKSDARDMKNTTHNKKEQSDEIKAHIDVTKIKNENGSIIEVEFYHNKTGMYETGKSYNDLDLLRNHSFYASENGTISNLTLYKYLHTNRWSNETSNRKNGPLSESPYSYLDQSEGSNATGDAIIKNLTLSKDYMEEDNSTIEHEGVSNETNSNETRLGQFIQATSSLVELGQQAVENGGSGADVTDSLNGTNNSNGEQNGAVDSTSNANGGQSVFLDSNNNFAIGDQNGSTSPNNNPNAEQNGSVNSNANINGDQTGSTNSNANINGDQTGSTNYNTNVNGGQSASTNYNTNVNGGQSASTNYNTNANSVQGGPETYNANTNGGAQNGVNTNVNANNINANGQSFPANYNNIGNVDQTASLDYAAQPDLVNGTSNTTSSADESLDNSTILNSDENSNGTHNDTITSYQNALESDAGTTNDTDVKDDSENKTDITNTDFSYLHKNPRPNITDPMVSLNRILAENDTNDNNRYFSGNETDDASLLGNNTEVTGGANVTSDDSNNVTSVFVDSANENDLNNTTNDNNNGTIQTQTQPNAQLGTQPIVQPGTQSNAQPNAQPDAQLNTQADQTFPPSNTNGATGGNQLLNSSSIMHQFEPLLAALNGTDNDIVYNQKPIEVKDSEQVLLSPKNDTKGKDKKKEKEGVNVKVFSSGVTNVYVDHKGNVDVRRVDKKNSTSAKNKTKPFQKSAKNLKGDEVLEEDLMKAEPKNEFLNDKFLTHDKEPKKKDVGVKNEKESMNLNITTFENAKIDETTDDIENDTNVYIDSKAFTKNITTHIARDGGHTAPKNTSHKTAFKVKSVNMTSSSKGKGNNKTTSIIDKKNDTLNHNDLESNSEAQKVTHNIKSTNTSSKVNSNKNNIKATASKGSAGVKTKKNFDVFSKPGEKNTSSLIAKDKTNPVSFSKNTKELLHHNEKTGNNNVKNVSAHNISASDVSRSALTIVEDLVDIINSTHGKNKKNGSNSSDKAVKQKITRYALTKRGHGRRQHFPAHSLTNVPVQTEKGLFGGESDKPKEKRKLHIIETTSTTVSGIKKQDLSDKSAHVQKVEPSSTAKRHHLLRHRKGKKSSVHAYSPVSLVKRDAYEQMTSSQDDDDTDEDEVRKHSEISHDANVPFDDSNRLVKKSSVIPPDYVEIESDKLPVPVQQTAQGQLLDSVKGNTFPTPYGMEMASHSIPQQAYVVEQQSEPVIVEEVDPLRLEAIKKSEIPEEYITVQPLRLRAMNYKKSQIPSEYVPEVVEPPPLADIKKGDIPPEQLPEEIEPDSLRKEDTLPEYVSAEAEHLETIKKGQIASEYISEAVQPETRESNRKSDILPEYVSDEQHFGHAATKKHSRTHIPAKDRARKVKLQELAATSEVKNGGNAERSDNNRPQYIEKRDKIWTDDHDEDSSEESNVVDDTDEDSTTIANPADGSIVKTDGEETPSELRSNILNMLSSSETTMSSSSSPSTGVSKNSTFASGGDERTDAESGSAENTAVTSGEDAGSAEPTDESSPSVNTKRDIIARPVPVMGEGEGDNEASETTEISKRNDVEKEKDNDSAEKSSDAGNPDISGSGGNSGSGSDHERVVHYGNKKKNAGEHSDGARESIVKKLVNEMAHAAAGSVKEGAHVVVKKSNILKAAKQHEMVKRSRLSEEEIVNYSNNKDIHAALKMLVNSLITKGPGKSTANEHLLRVKRMESEEKLENDILARSSILKNSSLTGETKQRIVQGVRDFEGLGEELSQSDFLTPYKHDVIASKLEGDLVKNLRLDKEQSATIYKEEDDLLKATEMEFIKDKIDREFSSNDGASRGDKINAIKRTIKSLPLSKEDSDDLTKTIQEANWLGVGSSSRKKKSKLKHPYV